MKVIKTRESYVIEAKTKFEIERDIKCDENYEFPEQQLLLDTDVKNVRNIKGIFKSNARSEFLEMVFTPDLLMFKSSNKDVNRFGYEVKTD